MILSDARMYIRRIEDDRVRSAALERWMELEIQSGHLADEVERMEAAGVGDGRAVELEQARLVGLVARSRGIGARQASALTAEAVGRIHGDGSDGAKVAAYALATSEYKRPQVSPAECLGQIRQVLDDLIGLAWARQEAVSAWALALVAEVLPFEEETTEVSI